MLPSVQLGGMDGVSWPILGQTYTPLHRSDACMVWHAMMPGGTFVPPHVHHTQDEFLYLLDGALDVETTQGTLPAAAGAMVSLPRGEMHGLFNRSGEATTCLFWVNPTGQLWNLFTAIAGMSDSAEVVRLARLHDITFSPS